MAFQLVVVGASAGGLPALIHLLSKLPSTFPLPILIVQHVDPRHQSLLAGILSRHTRLRVKDASAGERPRPGWVYMGPSDSHLTVASDGSIALEHDPPVHYVRPSVDRLFESAAGLGPVIAVVLTGSGSDGADGARLVAANGGIVIVENASSAAFSGMPQATINTGIASHVLDLEEIPSQLIALAGGEAIDDGR